ncbi:MAG: hypothetical protein ABFS46_16580 [Myxococcota bacterium]
MDLTWAALLAILCLASWLAARHKPPPCPPWVVQWVLWLAIFAGVVFVWLLFWEVSPLVRWLLILLTVLWIVWWFIYRWRCPAVSCTVAVEAIRFNHNSASATTDALSIRKDYGTPVGVPEWTAGETLPEESPAAYAILETQGQTVTVQVKFRITPTSVTQAEIRAEGGGGLGTLDAQSVQFSSGVSSPEFVTFNLNHQQIGAAGVRREDIEWRWKYRCPGESGWRDADVTRHRIYIVLETPKAPWDQTPGSTSNPWTDVLDYACAWADGESARDTAAGAVTEDVNGALALTYDMASGASKYTTPAAGQYFECTQFIDYLENGTGLGNVVNCTDCATIVTTFANVLGCDLHASRRQSYFDLTPIKALGQAACGCPNWGCGFSYHEVAWKGAGGESDELFDACLQVDGDTDPWSPPHTDLLPVNVPFTSLPGAPLPIPTPLSAATYRERLCTNDVGGIGSCNATSPWGGSNNGRRTVI